MTSEPVLDLREPAPVRVAAVDDHPVVLRGVARSLEEAGSRVRLVAVEPSVAALLRGGHDVDVVLLDLRIPGEDDVAANVARVRATGPQVVLFTSDHRPALVRAALDAGALGMVLKDDEEGSALVEAVLAAHAGHHHVSGDLAAAVVDDAQAMVRLSPREIEVLTHLARGLPYRAIARQMGVSEATIPSYLKRVAAKYAAAGVTNRGPHELAAAAARDGIVDLGAGC